MKNFTAKEQIFLLDRMKFVASFLPCLYDFLDFQDDKKMIRYRDGKIVSTKGERYTQVTKAESDEMKKSYVNNS